MNYDIKIINNYESKGRIELDRVKFLATHIKNIAQKSLLILLYGYSKISLPSSLKKHLQIYLNQTQSNDGYVVFTMDADYFKNIPLQLRLFEDAPPLDKLTPMALVIQTFRAALFDTEDKNLLDEPLIDELLKFKHFFHDEREKILLSNRNTISEVEFSKHDIQKIEQLYKSIPAPQKTTVAGEVDEMKFSKEQVILKTDDNQRVIIVVKKDQFEYLKEFFGKEILIEGMAHFKPGGQLSYIQMEKFDTADSHLMKMFSKKPHKMTLQQQIALQLREGKKPGPIDEIFGKWPGDESLDDLLNMLKNLE